LPNFPFITGERQVDREIQLLQSALSTPKNKYINR